MKKTSERNFNLLKLLKEYKLQLISCILVGSLSLGISTNYYLNKKDKKSKISNPLSSYSQFMKSFFRTQSEAIINSITKKISDIAEKSIFDFDINFDDMPPYDGTVESSLAIARYVREKVKDIPNEVKYEYVVNHFVLSHDQYLFFDAIVNKEATPYVPERYEDAFAVVTSIHNRVKSDSVCKIVKNWSEEITDFVTIIDHLVAKNQYQPYGNKSYLEVLGEFDSESSQALLDCLFVIDVAPYTMHPYLDFVGWGYESIKDVNIKMVPHGNNFSNPIEESDIIPLEERYYYKMTQVMDNFSKALVKSDFR